MAPAFPAPVRLAAGAGFCGAADAVVALGLAELELALELWLAVELALEATLGTAGPLGIAGALGTADALGIAGALGTDIDCCAWAALFVALKVADRDAAAVDSSEPVAVAAPASDAFEALPAD
jgi:hypothetical protein